MSLRRGATFLLVCVIPALAQGPITFQYFYDDLNQLVKVVDSTGVVIGYVYDPVGNILQISRSTVASGVLSIFNVIPQIVATGATITIQGQGFSTTPSLDIVTIGGAQATVVSATSTTLVVNVPLNAVNGAIVVKVGSASATSPANETVIPAPIISSVKPRAMQAPNTATVVVTGANLAGATFSFAPAISAVTVILATINPAGTSATLSVVASANAYGQFAVVATNSGGVNSGLTAGTNSFGIFTDPNADADNDGLANGYELLLGTDPFNSDSDGDGFSDGVEVASRSDPLNPACTPLNCRVSGEEDGVVFSTINSASTVSVPTEADSVVFSTLDSVSTVNVPTEADSVVFSVLNLQMPVTLLSEADSTPFSICNSLGSCANYAPLTPAARRPPAITSLPPTENDRKISGDPRFGARKPLAVASVTSPNRVTDIASATLVTLVFSTPLDPASINKRNFQLWAERIGPDASPEKEILNPEIRYSSDFRTVMFNTSLPANTRLSMRATTGVQDIWGRHLEDFQSGLATATSQEGTPSFFLDQRPPGGASGVPVDANIELFLSAALDQSRSTIPLEVTQEGQLVQGEVHLAAGGTRVQFVPAQPFRQGTDVRVRVSDVRDKTGSTSADFESTFRTEEGSGILAEPIRASPGNSVEVSLNPVIEVEYSRPLAPATVNIGTVMLREISTSRPVAAAVSLRHERIIRIQPAESLAPNSGYAIELSSGLRDLTEQPAASFQQAFMTSTDSRATTMHVNFAEPKEGITVSERAEFRLTFGGPINPLTLDEQTIRVTEDGTPVPVAIALVEGGADVILTPFRALKGSGFILVTVSGVEDLRGIPIAPGTAGFRVQPSQDAPLSEPRKAAGGGNRKMAQALRNFAGVLYGGR